MGKPGARSAGRWTGSRTAWGATKSGEPQLRQGSKTRLSLLGRPNTGEMGEPTAEAWGQRRGAPARQNLRFLSYKEAFPWPVSVPSALRPSPGPLCSLGKWLALGGQESGRGGGAIVAA